MTHVIAMARLATGVSMATSSTSTDTMDCSPFVSGVESDTSSTSCSCTSVPTLLDRLRHHRNLSWLGKVKPSSAAAERIFSLLKCCFGDQQETTLLDYIETSLMLYTV